MNNLRTFTLDDCINIPFFLALVPAQNSSNTVACPTLGELALDLREDVSYISDLSEMPKQRASIGAHKAVDYCDHPLVKNDFRGRRR